ncbi:hypothetical protein NC653_029400 [Populus alba x Populus x berolinensis]|uniref:Uncharacterized protein n=1 Tax=Populus alba x Populus x berolinensis TaxID=444605 RepID=A0AAD6Q4D8_9ROSI|nr:hypothetical protein NC653_029400 [Populus alba x Populus x berolinensis]
MVLDSFVLAWRHLHMCLSTKTITTARQAFAAH